MGILDALRNWRERRQAMAELKEIRQEEAPYKELEKGRLLGLMVEASVREDPAMAAATWQRLYIVDRDLAITSPRAISILIGMKLQDLAEQAIAEAIERFPMAPGPFENRATLAQNQNNMERAAECWAEVRKRFPDRTAGYSMGGECLMWLGRLDEADALLAVAFNREPDDFEIARKYAYIAEYAKKWEQALEHWNYCREHFAKPYPWIAAAKCLFELDRPFDAEQLLLKAETQFQANLNILSDLAWCAMKRGDTAEALVRWTLVRDAYPREAIGYTGAVQVYLSMGKTDEADEMMRTGIERNDDDAELLVEYGRLAHNRGDWDAAIERWTVLTERFPDRPEGPAALAAALHAAGRDQGVAGATNAQAG